jgi:hypothetical protein
MSQASEGRFENGDWLPKVVGSDEDLRGSILRAVRRRKAEVEITSVVEQGLSSANDEEVLDFAWRHQWPVVSHDVNTMTSFAERRVADGRGIHGLFLAPQNRASRLVSECLILIWSASDFEEWRDRIVYVPI